MKKAFGILFLAVILTAGTGTANKENDSSPGSVTVLALIADGFGESLPIIQEILESYGWQVLTAGTSAEVRPCPRKAIDRLRPDYLIEEMTERHLDDIQCILVPSGGHWHALSSFKPAAILVAAAERKGVVISAICTGPALLATADILMGRKIACHPNVAPLVKDAGGIILDSMRVVIDGRIVTGGGGGGLDRGGVQAAPNREFCEALKKVLENKNL